MNGHEPTHEPTSYQKSRYVLFTTNDITLVFIARTRGMTRPSVMLGPAGLAAQTCPGAAPATTGQRAPRPAAPRVAALSTRMRLGYDGLRPAWRRHGEAGRPRLARPVRLPSNKNARGPLGESGRRGGCSESDYLPSQNVSGQQAHQLPPPPRR